MSKTTAITLAIIVILVVAGIWWWTASQPGSGPAGQTETAATNNGASQAPALSSGTSNADLNQNLAQIQSQMNGLSSDTASIDQGLNDQPISQTQL